MNATLLARTLAAAVLCAVMLPGATVAAPWGSGTFDRTEALRKIQSSQMEQRRLGYGRLGEIGTQEDVPLLLAALSDEEELIRGMAEIAIWGIWMRADDSSADPMFQVALDLVHQDRLEEAEAKFTEVLVIKPEFAEAFRRRGEAKVLRDRWADAEQDFLRTLELNPYHFGALEGLGHCAMQAGRHEEAVAHFTRALELNPNLEGVREALRRARRLAEKGRT